MGASPFLAKPAYAETHPIGATPGGDIGGDVQAGEAFTRRFVWLMPGGDTVAVIEDSVYVSCPQGDNPGQPNPETLALTRQTQYTVCTDASRVYDTELYSDTVYQPITWTIPRPPTDDDARAACDATNPNSFDWDGTPDAFWPCTLATTTTSTGAYQAACTRHKTVSSLSETSLSRAWQSFACDRGRRWRFIVDDRDGEHRMTDLTGVRAAITAAVQAEQAEGAGASPLKVYLYRGQGITQRVDWSLGAAGEDPSRPWCRLHARSYVLHEWRISLPVDTAAYA